MKRKIFWLFIGALFIIGTRWTLSQMSQYQPWHKESWQSLYTHINLTIQGDSAKVRESIRELDVFFTDFTKSYQNGGPLQQKIFNARIHDTLFVDSTSYALLAFGEKVFSESNGKIHVGIGNLLKLWGLEWGQTPHVPEDSLLAIEKEKLKTLFYKTLDNGKSIEILQDSARLALGAFSKGFALEWARQKLLQKGFQNFLLEIGGDLVYNGQNPHRSSWKIGITDPFNKEGFLMILNLPPHYNAMATSGGYERFFTDEKGNKHHHILNPATALPTKNMASTTVFAPTGFEADYLATRLFVEGFEASQKIQNTMTHFQSILVSPDAKIWVHPELIPLRQQENK